MKYLTHFFYISIDSKQECAAWQCLGLSLFIGSFPTYYKILKLKRFSIFKNHGILWFKIFCMYIVTHDHILCWKISCHGEEKMFLNFLPKGSFCSHKFSNWDTKYIVNTHIFETSGHFFISCHRLDRVGKTLPKIIILTQFTD